VARGPGGWRLLAIRFIAMVVVPALLWGSVEFGLRLLHLEKLESEWMPTDLVDHAVFWRPLGDDLENPLGVSRYWRPLRGARPSERPSEGITRIICLGGSSTYGWPYEDEQVAYPARLEAELNRGGGSGPGGLHPADVELPRVARPLDGGRQLFLQPPASGLKLQNGRSPGWEVLNAGEGGFTLFQGLMYLETKLLAYHPSVVTVCFGTNDGSDNTGIGTTGTDEEYWDWVCRSAGNSRLFELRDRLNGLRTFVLLRQVVSWGRQKGLQWFTWPERRVPPERFGELLAKVAVLGRRDRFRPVFLTEASRTLRNRGEYREVLLRTAAREGVQAIDLHAGLPAGPEERAPLFYDEAHLTERGHRLVAEQVARELAAWRGR
jgi:lysophospholipase L1-like esterase